MQASISPHVLLDERGVALIEGTRIKVAFLIELHEGYAGNIAEIQRHLPSLSLAQIYGALTYYYDHKDDLDAEIARRRSLADEAREDSRRSPLGQRLSALMESAAKALANAAFHPVDHLLV